jgi:hypothetical protein
MTETHTVSLKSAKTVQLHSDDNLDIYHYPELKIMHYYWKCRTLGDEYRRLFSLGLDLAVSHPTIYFLSDICNQGIVGPEDRKWFETVAIPGAIEKGLEKAAVVFDGNIFKMYYLNLLLQTFVKKGVPMKFFRDNNQAVEWLKSS